MFYYLIYLLCFPFLFIASILRQPNNNKLIIQTAKIGDYVNTSIMIDVLQKVDVIIDIVNYDLASNDSRINNIFVVNEYKYTLFTKIKLALQLYKNNYSNIYVVMPNNYNLFLANMSFAKNKTTLKTYASKWYFNLLSLGMQKKIHTQEDLTLSSYVQMIKSSYSYKSYRRIIQKPLIINESSQISNDLFNVGISLTAGNKLKTIDIKTWRKIIDILNKFQLQIYIFGLSSEQQYLDSFMSAIHSNNPIISLLGRINLQHLPSEITKMQLYISSDTGNSYIADSLNIPVINFSGPCYMQEQRPIGERSIIINSNVKNTPFSFIFKAPYSSNIQNLYGIDYQETVEIQSFITDIYKDFREVS